MRSPTTSCVVGFSSATPSTVMVLEPAPAIRALFDGLYTGEAIAAERGDRVRGDQEHERVDEQRGAEEDDHQLPEPAQEISGHAITPS